MKQFKLLLSLLGFLLCVKTGVHGESSTCLTVYKEGGAPAVFQSPKCPRWKLSNYASRRTIACQSAIHQGRRRSQEDRTLCALDVHIPLLGSMGITEVTVGIVAVFDGHNGAEASEMASKLLLEYFVLHTYFLLDATYSVLLKKSMARLPNVGDHDVLNWGEELHRRGSDLARFKFTLPELSDGSFHLDILKESLLRAIHDIDVTFSTDALRNNLDSGSTATVILIADGHILVANVGDSKALMCSEKFLSPAEARAKSFRLYRQQRSSGAISSVKDYAKLKVTSNRLAHFFVKELTSDHHPDRDDERFRVESAGGYVLEWGGVSRVNGQLAVSRAIGDVSFKGYGVTSAPEVTDWKALTTNDSYLVAASDGIFETLSPQDLCDILWELHNHGTVRSELYSSCSDSMADCIIKTAFEKGSMDNMAAVVVPLRSTEFYRRFMKQRCGSEGDINCPALGLQTLIFEQTANDIASDRVHLDHAHPITATFDRLLVEGKRGSLGCFYLSENLNENMEAAFEIQKDDQNNLLQALPDVPDHQYGGYLNLYRDQNLCLHFGMTADGIRDQCRNTEGFDNFLSLLESIPFHSTGSNYRMIEHDMPNLRYMLKKRFDRGSYGEVWLAFHWNCSQGHNASNWSSKNRNFLFNTNNLKFDDKNSQWKWNFSSQNCRADPLDNLFVLKRIMVERGTTVYLSGLREKHFGEIFLNASTVLSDSLLVGTSNSFLNGSDLDIYGLMGMKNSGVQELENTWNFENVYQNRNRLHRHVYEEGLNHIARYVESFESQSNEIWLVFRHEGVSLSKVMYTAEEIENDADEERDEGIKHVQVLHPSKWWHWLKTTEAGQEEMRNLIWQLLVALKSCHDRNITHRDIKPENMVICFEDPETRRCLKGSPSGEKKYNTKIAEQTFEYAPPEALLNASWYQGPTSMTLKYDMWSVGVVILELILGSPNVFQINALTRTLLDQHLEGWNEGLKELAYKLRSFMEMCILIPGSSSKHQRIVGTNDLGGVSPASWKCSEEFFSLQVKSRDPLKLGFPNVWALRLVRQLLLWDPDDRLSVDDALRHPYFQHPKR
ncbi:uncharacterized protein LOC131156200 isoform X3 [Malania oleifera]|uniref:uncharacterized protein LOC131156200 isoform X3 n=2 Tax=Malania oleifera TaxID=397392 RepID=UPI0025AE726A|nr:uncharacterized protein LOC131156200 isoform X3 [Malania oleifera]